MSVSVDRVRWDFTTLAGQFYGFESRCLFNFMGHMGASSALMEDVERWTPSFGQVFVTAKVESGFMIQATLG